MGASTTSPEQVVRAFYAAWDTQGFGPAFHDFFAADAIWQNNADEPRVGREAIDEAIAVYLRVFRRPFARVEVVNLAVSGDVVLTERVEHCENRDTGDTYVGRHMSAFTIREGRIARFNDYFDPTDYRTGAAIPKG